MSYHETTLRKYKEIANMTVDTYNKNLVTLGLSSIFEMSQNKQYSFYQQTIAMTIFYYTLNTTAGIIYLKSNKDLTVAIEANAKAFLIKNINEDYDDTVPELFMTIYKFTKKNENVFKHHNITYTLYMSKNKSFKTFKGNKENPKEMSIIFGKLKEEIRREIKQIMYDTRLVCKDIAGVISNYVC